MREQVESPHNTRALGVDGAVGLQAQVIHDAPANIALPSSISNGGLHFACYHQRTTEGATLCSHIQGYPR